MLICGLASDLHALRPSASADLKLDGKRLGACGKRLRVALNSAKRTLEGGAGGRYGPTLRGRRRHLEIFFSSWSTTGANLEPYLRQLGSSKVAKSGPKAAKRPSRGAQERPRAAQERPKSGQERPKSGPRAAKSGPRATMSEPRAAKRSPRAAKSSPRATKNGPRAAKRGLGAVLGPSWRIFGTILGPKMCVFP